MTPRLKSGDWLTPERIRAYSLIVLALSLAAITSIVWCWRWGCDEAHKAALLVTATLVASPHILDYDLIVLAVVIAHLAARGLRAGFRPFEITLLGALWIVPLLARSTAGVLALPVGFFVIAIFYLTTVTQIWREATSHGQPNFAKT